MDSADQAIGEKRVRQMLIDPLMRRGLGRPTTLTKQEFEDMARDLCARLAYMSEENLMALEEQAATHPGGPSKDRFPIANNILRWAGMIQPPHDSASPLIRAVFAAQIGRDAIDQGWAPELLAEVKRTREWPGRYVLSKVRSAADDAMRKMWSIEQSLTRNEPVDQDGLAWRQRRLDAMHRCRDIASMSSASGGSA